MFDRAAARSSAAVSPMLPVALRPIRGPGLRFALTTLALLAPAGAAGAAAVGAGGAAVAQAATRSGGEPLGAAAAGIAAAGAPSCTPQTLDASAQLDGAVTVSPMPGAADASPATQISFLGVPLGALSDVTVTGSVSGAHNGQLEPYSQGDGGSFVPQKPFVAGETVTVSARARRSPARRSRCGSRSSSPTTIR